MPSRHSEQRLHRLRFFFQGREYACDLRAVFLLTLLIGLTGGIYGIGGGSILAPFLVSGFRLPVHVTAGPTLLCTLVTSTGGVLIYELHCPLYPGLSVGPDWTLGCFSVWAALRACMPARAARSICRNVPSGCCLRSLSWARLSAGFYPSSDFQGHAMLDVPLQRVAAIHDLSGFGRASLTVVIPILASMGVQVCPLPTAVLSSQTSGVEGFTFHDLTSEMGPMLDHWESMGLKFDAVYSGFLGNPRQLEIAARCIRDFLRPGGFALVDPVLGDNGVLDPTQTPEMVEAMRRLVRHAHVISPNLTEAAFLLNEPFRPGLSRQDLKAQLVRLADMGPDRVIITSAPSERKGFCAAVAYDREQNRFWKVESPWIPAFYPGTGDTFSSVLAGAFLQGDSLPSLWNAPYGSSLWASGSLSATIPGTATAYCWNAPFPPCVTAVT